MFSALHKVKSTEDGPLGPGSDLLAALLGTFVLLAVSEKEGLGVRSYQMDMIESIKHAYQARETKEAGSQTYKLFGGELGRDTIVIRNEATLQHFYFGGNILFRSRADAINGANALGLIKTIGDTIKKKIDHIREIQIQGHADAISNDTFNLDLAARRAATIFWILKNNSKIDP